MIAMDILTRSDVPGTLVHMNTNNVQPAIGDRVTAPHIGDTVVTGTVIDVQPRGMFSVAAYLVDWDTLGPTWESPDVLTITSHPRTESSRFVVIVEQPGGAHVHYFDTDVDARRYIVTIPYGWSLRFVGIHRYDSVYS